MYRRTKIAQIASGTLQEAASKSLTIKQDIMVIGFWQNDKKLLSRHSLLKSFMTATMNEFIPQPRLQTKAGCRFADDLLLEFLLLATKV